MRNSTFLCSPDYPTLHLYEPSIRMYTPYFYYSCMMLTFTGHKKVLQYAHAM